MLGTLYEAIEVVGIDGVLVFDGGHAEGLAQVVGDEGSLASCLGQLTLVEGEEDEVAEVEVARLEHTHDLQADGRLAVERYGGGGEQAAQQTLQCVGAQGQVAAFHQAEQAAHDGVGLEQRFAVELVEDVVGGRSVGLGTIEYCHLLEHLAEVCAKRG